jgi:Fe-Mn family superoxide dismutase
MSLEDIIRQANGPIFNNAAQIFNHDYFFKGMTNKPTTPSAELLSLIETTFGSMDAMKELFLKSCTDLFGSGWVWLSIDKEKNLRIGQTCNANTPLRYGLHPLMACDIWEHAYYIDYRNNRPQYLAGWWELIDWTFVSENLAAFMQVGKQKYLQECPEETIVCDYLDALQDNERIET